MTPLHLHTWFRRRMLLLVAASSLVVASAAPAAYHVQKRRELVRAARAHAARVAEVVRAEIEERSILWRYDSTKLASRLVAEGQGLTLERRVSADPRAVLGIEVAEQQSRNQEAA